MYFVRNANFAVYRRRGFGNRRRSSVSTRQFHVLPCIIHYRMRGAKGIIIRVAVRWLSLSPPPLSPLLSLSVSFSLSLSESQSIRGIEWQFGCMRANFLEFRAGSPSIYRYNWARFLQKASSGDFPRRTFLVYERTRRCQLAVTSCRKETWSNLWQSCSWKRNVYTKKYRPRL